jgi:polysaccharide biosynthesis transport protein
VTIADERPSTLRDYLDALRRRKWIVLQAVIVVPIVAVLLSLRDPTLYRASASVLLNTQNLPANLEGVTDPSQYNPSRLLQTQVEIARIPEVARRTIKAAGLDGWDASQLIGTSSVSTRENSDMLMFSVSNGDPELAAQLATEYARQYTRYRYELDTQALRVAQESVVKKMQKLRANGAAGSALYASLAEKKDQLETLQSLQTSRAIVVRLASGAAKVQPQPSRNAMFGVVLGLFLGIGLAALLEALDSRLRSSETIVDRLGLPLLARIPEPPRRLKKKDRLVMLDDPNGPEAEAFRILMTNLELAHLEEPAHAVMFTSAVEKEGKSTTVANLAVALARAGRRIVLVDLDFRNPSLHRFFGLASTPGLTDVALGRVPLKDAIARVDIGSRSLDSLAPVESRSNGGRWGSGGQRNATPMWTGAEATHLKDGKLEVLLAGTHSANPGELIAQLPIGPILDHVKGQADFVLVDGPPLLQVGDAITLSSVVDALIVVARINVVRAPMLDDLNRVLRACPASKLGLVVAGAELETGYGYFSYPRKRLKAVV